MNSTNSDGHSNEAFALLDIEPETFNNIPTPQLKDTYLRYKLLKYEQAQANNNPNLTAANLEAAYDAYGAIQDLVYNQNTIANKAAVTQANGLRMFNVLNDADNPFVMIQDLAEGVEPKYKACTEMDILLHVSDNSVNFNDRMQMLRQLNSKTALKSYYENHKTELPLYLVKFDYNNIDSKHQVTGNLENLKKTNAIKNIDKKVGKAFGKKAGKLAENAGAKVFQRIKKDSSNNKMQEAVLETLGNDFCRNLGINTQDQFLSVSHHEDGSIKMLPVGEWNHQARPLTIDGDKGDNKICVEYVLKSENGVKGLADPNLNLGRYLVLFLALGDRDALGSRGQNKLREGDNLYAIDIGHLLGSKVLPHIDYDFHINDAKFKNYSVLYDAPRSEMMKGMLVFQKIMGREIDSEIIASYGPDFVRELAAIQPYGLFKTTAEYIHVLTEMQSEYTGYNLKGLEKTVKAVENVNKKLFAVHHGLEKKFESYLNLSADQINLIENIEFAGYGKAGSTLRSKDNQFLLNHIARNEASNIKVKQVITNPGADATKIEFVFQGSTDAAATFAKNLEKWIKNNSAAIKLPISISNNSCSFSIPNANLAELNAIFNIDKIKSTYHQADYALRQTYVQETAIKKMCQQFDLANVNLQYVNGHYQLTLTPKSSQMLTPITEQIIRELFKSVGKDEISCVIKSTDLQQVAEMLQAVRHHIDLQNTHAAALVAEVETPANRAVPAAMPESSNNANNKIERFLLADVKANENLFQCAMRNINPAALNWVLSKEKYITVNEMVSALPNLFAKYPLEMDQAVKCLSVMMQYHLNRTTPNLVAASKLQESFCTTFEKLTSKSADNLKQYFAKINGQSGEPLLNKFVSKMGKIVNKGGASFAKLNKLILPLIVAGMNPARRDSKGISAIQMIKQQGNFALYNVLAKVMRNMHLNPQLPMRKALQDSQEFFQAANKTKVKLAAPIASASTVTKKNN